MTFESRLGFNHVAVHFGTFEFGVNVVVGPKANLAKYVNFKHERDDATVPSARGLSYHREGYWPVLWLPRVPRTVREHATLAHEMLHVVREMLVDYAGIPLTRDTDEAFCHALAFGIRTTMEGLRK